MSKRKKDKRHLVKTVTDAYKVINYVTASELGCGTKNLAPFYYIRLNIFFFSVYKTIAREKKKNKQQKYLYSIVATIYIAFSVVPLVNIINKTLSTLTL